MGELPVFFQPWWGSTQFVTTSSLVLQRCSPFFLLLPSWPSPRLLSSLQGSTQQPAQTTHSVALARLVDLLMCQLILLLMRLLSSSMLPSQLFLLFQVWKLMLLLRMPSLLGWELLLGPSGTKHTWLLRLDLSSSSSRLLTSTTLTIKLKRVFSNASFNKEGAVNKRYHTK